MLYYDETDLSKEIDVCKNNSSKECTVCHYWFFNHGCKFQDSVCDGWHDLTMLCLNIILLLSLLSILLLFIKLANLKELIYFKKYVLDDCGYI